MPLQAILLVIVLGTPEVFERKNRSLDPTAQLTFDLIPRSVDESALTIIRVPDRGAILEARTFERGLVPEPEEFEYTLPRNFIGCELDLERLRVIS